MEFPFPFRPDVTLSPDTQEIKPYDPVPLTQDIKIQVLTNPFTYWWSDHRLLFQGTMHGHETLRVRPKRDEGHYQLENVVCKQKILIQISLPDLLQTNYSALEIGT